MKKVLIIPSWYPTISQPLKGSFFKEQAELLSTSGFDIKVLFGEVKSTSYINIIKTKISRKIEFNDVLQCPEAFGFYLPNNRRIKDRAYLNAARKKYLKVFRELLSNGWIPDIIHAQSGMDAGIFAHEISKKFDIPFVIIEHQVFVFHYYSKLRAQLVLDAFKVARKVAAVSYDERRQILMNQPECNPEVIWNLVDETKLEINLKKRRKPFTIITILNSFPVKGAITFLEAIKEVIKQDKDVEFIMIGKGGDTDSNSAGNNVFITKSKELGIYEMGTFLPFVQRDKIGEILNQAHVFVSPSIQEPHGIAVREAMMCGLPIVTTANGGVEDSINPKTGLVVPVKDSKALAIAILKVKNKEVQFDPEKIRELAVLQCGKRAFIESMRKFYNL
ncbi:glycosyltransferase [Echinicola sp. 20G]|uniref:glycosyltransferase n=1 Tax=Echinicola sp. 20G TaxID=2781961 RepID=UPI001910DA71|nr:glycosyltransferase [Echinicola sp. 20G]